MIRELEQYHDLILEEANHIQKQIWDLRLGKIEPREVEL
jgi:hypothetical protein